jgi:hypothetical protein
MLKAYVSKYLLGSSPTDAWYNEITTYDYTTGASTTSAETGHFTQVIWAGSTQLGIGIGYSSDSKTVTVTANYYPAGNVQGSYIANVLPLCSNGVGGD